MTKRKFIDFSLGVIIPLVAVVLYLTLPWQGLDILALDFRQRLNFADSKDSPFLFQTLPARAKNQVTLKFIQPQILKAIEQLSIQKAKAIVILLDNQYWQEPASSEELTAFRNRLAANPRVYLYQERKGSYLPTLAEFQDFPRIFSFFDKCYDGPGMQPEDHKSRRLLLRYQENKELASPFKFLNDLGFVVPDSTFAKTFDLMGTDQYYIKYYPADQLRLGGTDIDLSNKVVFLGYQDIFSGTMSLTPLASKDQGPATSSINAREMFEGEYLAQLFYGLVRGEHIQEIHAAIPLATFLLFVLSLTILTLRIDEPQMAARTIALLLTVNGLPFLLLFIFDINFPAVPFAFTSVLIPYVTIPRTLFRMQKEKAILNRKMQELRFEGHLAARSAEADATFRLATRVAHDIRGPLSALQTLGKFSSAHLDQKKLALYQRALGRLEDITSSLLLIYKTSGRFGKSQKGLYSLSQLERVLSLHLNDVAPEIQFRFTNQSQEEYISVSRVELERHLLNLINNSIEALRSSSTLSPEIRMNVIRDNEHLQILISDNGPGIADEIKERIFQDGATFGKKGGNGMALSACRQFSRNLAGDLILLPSVQGASFKMSFKAFQPRFEIAVDPESHLVVIDDDPDILESFQIQLQQLPTDFTTRQCHFLQNPLDGQKLVRDLCKRGQRVTVISDLVFENSDVLGFDILAENSGANFLYSSLAGEEKIKTICDKAAYHLVAKDLEIRIRFAT